MTPTHHNVQQGTAYDAIRALNWSTLKLMARSPRALQRAAVIPRTDSEWLLLGRAIHCAALEPDEFSSRYVIAPKVDRRTTKGKADWEAFQADAGPREVLDRDAGHIIDQTSRALRGHSVACEMLAGKKEQVITWTDAETGIACKGRVDVAGTRIVDLKSSSHGGSVRMLLREAAQRDYHGQCAWYHDGAVASGLGLTELPAVVFVETSEPFDVVVLDMDLAPETMDEGRALYRRLLAEYQGCKLTDYWPGMAPDALPWTLPKWKRSAEE